MNREKRGDPSLHPDSVGQLELPLRAAEVPTVEQEFESNVLAFRVKQPRPTNSKPDALDRILAYAETLSP